MEATCKRVEIGEERATVRWEGEVGDTGAWLEGGGGGDTGDCLLSCCCASCSCRSSRVAAATACCTFT